MDQKVIDHQKNLDQAFRWVEFAYREGNGLLEAMKSRLTDRGFPDPLLCLLYSLSKTSASKYVWIDGCWYVPAKDEPIRRVPFVALSYFSYQRTGSHLVVGVAEIEDEGAGLLGKPKKGKDRQWLLDEVLNTDDYPGLFHVSLAPDGLVEHLLRKPVEAYHQGLQKVRSAPFPVAWIQAETRLEQVAQRLASLRETGDGAELGALSQEALASAGPAAP